MLMFHYQLYIVFTNSEFLTNHLRLNILNSEKRMMHFANCICECLNQIKLASKNIRDKKV